MPASSLYGIKPHTIKAIRQQQFNLPTHWVQDWLMHVLDKSDTFLITNSDYQLSANELATFNTGIEKMQAGTPLAYLIGKQEFWSLEFMVNEHTLIPRPDTEVLVEQVLHWIKAQYANGKYTKTKAQDSLSKPYQLLDLGTGTGCIAISLAHELERFYQGYQGYQGQWQVTAVDYSQGAVDIAKKNVSLNNVNNVTVINSDWFGALDTKNEEENARYDVIVANPPYIDTKDSHLDNLKAEPLSALVADNHGLADIEKIISGAIDYLKVGGLLAIEHGYNQADAVRRLFEQYGFNEVKTIQDYGNNDRVTIGECTASDKV